MGLIKAEHRPTSMMPFSMRDVEQEAREMLLRARRQADQLLAAAQVEAERLKKEAHAQGLLEGKREGMSAGIEAGKALGKKEAMAANTDSLRQLISALTLSISTLETHRNVIESAGLADVVKLSMALARRVTKRQALIEPEVLADNLSQAMGFVSHASDIRIAVNPVQLGTLKNVLEELRIQWPNLKHVEIVEDASLSQGSCRIFTHQGFVDADLDAQLDRIMTELLPFQLETST